MESLATAAAPARRIGAETATWIVTGTLLAIGSLVPARDPALILAVATGLASLAPVVAIAALLAGALTLGTWSDRVLARVRGGQVRAIVLASVAGTITPVCGLGVLPLIATLLRRGLPLAPVMAFWVSSPIMGPSMLVMTIEIMGAPFAAAKVLAAFGTGLLAGAVTARLPAFAGPGYRSMRPERMAGITGCEPQPGFWSETWQSARLVVRWLALALVLEVFVSRLVPDAWIASRFGATSAGSVPLAAMVGAPLYLDGYAALPLVRGLVDKGMSFGAALALMVSGAAVSLYAAAAVVSIVRLRVFALYVVLAMAGACAAGYAANWIR